MSFTTIRRTFRAGGVLTDPDSFVVRDEGAVYGVRRTDTDAVVVAAGTAFTRLSTGVYQLTWEDPADSLTYDVAIEIVFGDETYRYALQVAGGAAPDAGNLYNLLDQILPYVPGCPEAVAEQVLRQVARDFCQQTHAMHETVSIETVAEEQEYALTPQADATVLRVTRVSLDDTPVRVFTVREDNTLRLPMEPSADQTIEAVVALLPKESTTTLPAWFLDRWGDALVAGTLSRLKSMPQKAWSAEDWQLYRQEYVDRKSKAKLEHLTGRTRGVVTYTPRRMV